MPDFTPAELRQEIRRASDRMAPISMVEVLDRPAVEIEPPDDVVEPMVVHLDARPDRRRWWIAGFAAAAAAVVVVAAVSLFERDDDDVRTNDDPPAATDEEPVPDKEPVPDEEPVTETGAEIFVEPAGTGPVLVWEEVSVPTTGYVRWLVHDDHQFIALDSLGALLVSEDGRSWSSVTTLGPVPNYAAFQPPTDWHAGRLVTIEARLGEPAVTTVDIETGSVTSTPLADLLAGVELPCDIADVADADAGCAVGQGGVIGPHGALIWISMTPARDSGDLVDSPEQMLRMAWHSPDGDTWTPVPAEGPWVPDSTSYPFRSGSSGSPPSPVAAAIEDGFVMVQPETAAGCRGANVWFSEDGLGWDLVQEWCMDSALADDAVNLELTSWGERAIASFGGDGWAWSGASPSEKPFWLVSRDGVARLDHEPLPMIAGIGTIDAGGAGIAVTYETWDPESEDDQERSNLVVEYSTDGRRWSRMAWPPGEGPGWLVVGNVVVLWDHSPKCLFCPGAGQAAVMVGTPE